MIVSRVLRALKSIGDAMSLVTSRSSIAKQPAEIRDYIEKLLINSQLTLDEKVADIQRQFPDVEDLPSRSALGRYGKKLERRLAAIRASTEAAKLIRDSAEDREDARSEALTAMLQSELFESLIELQEASDEDLPADKRIGLLSMAAKNIANLTRSSIALKTYQEAIAKKARDELLSEQKAALETLAQQGLSKNAIDLFKAEVLGL